MLFTPEEKELLLTLLTVEQSKLAVKEESEKHLKHIEMCEAIKHKLKRIS